MKRIIGYFLLFTVAISAFYFICIRAFKISLALIISFLLLWAIYAALFVLGWNSMARLQSYEHKAVRVSLNKKDKQKILFLSMATLSPLILCILLISIIPLFTYEVWLVTTFPYIVLTSISAMSVLETYRSLTRKRAPFILCFSSIILVCCLLGTWISGMIFKDLL